MTAVHNSASYVDIAGIRAPRANEAELCTRGTGDPALAGTQPAGTPAQLAGSALQRAGRALLRAGRAVSWYMSQLMGDSAYATYVAHQRRHHPDAAPLTERQFWRERMADQDRNPGARCC